MAIARGSRATLARKLVPRSSMGLLPKALPGGQRRLHDGYVAGTAAEMARQHIADLRLAGVGLVAQQGIQRDQDSRRAEAALQAVMLAEAVLQRGQAARLGRDALDGADLGALDLHGEREAGAAGPAVDLDGAGAADSVLAADMGAGGADHLAEEIRQQHARLRLARNRLAVQGEAQGMP